LSELATALSALEYGGAMVYPLLALGLVATVIIIDRAIVFRRFLRVPGDLVKLAETFGFSWTELERELSKVPPGNAYCRFLRAIAENQSKPGWWVESRAGDEAGEIETRIGHGLWILETIVTAAPLLGLLGTITGMMQSFNVIGKGGLVAPTQVTSGVAQALIATALGLLIALFALFAFNFFSRALSRTLDRMERLGSRVIDRIKLDQHELIEARPPERSIVPLDVDVTVEEVR
jgi:biopolymer transport protein ExbB